jgi:hypothetical protein
LNATFGNYGEIFDSRNVGPDTPLGIGHAAWGQNALLVEGRYPDVRPAALLR